MLTVQFTSKHSKKYQDLNVGDIFMILDGHMDSRVFIYTDSDESHYSVNDCVSLTEGRVYNFPSEAPVVILDNVKLIVEEE